MFKGGALALNAPAGGLTGKVDVINVTYGTDYAYSALALNEFLGSARHTKPFDDDLNLDSAAPVASIQGHLTNWSRGADAVSAVLATKKLFGGFNLDPATMAATTLIAFAPTRPFYAGRAPFSVAEPGCEPAGMSIFDSNGALTDSLAATPALCRTASAFAFGYSFDVIFDTPMAIAVQTSTENGSFSLNLESTSLMTTATASVNLGGLPVVGLVLQEYMNGVNNSNYSSALYAATDFNVLTFRTPVGLRENVDALIRFAPADVGRTGSIFITASIPSDKLSILNGTTALSLNSMVASAKPLAAASVAMVQVQLTATGWQLVSNGQYIPFTTGVNGDLMAAQNILKNTDTSSLAGAQFCLGYGTSAAEMAEAGRMTTILTLQGASVSNSCIVTGNPTTISNPIASSSVVEFYNSNLDHYFITADSNEAAQIDGGSAGSGWSRTGNSFKSGGNTPVCRFYGSQSPGPNSHFYTVDPGECDSLKQQQASTPATQKRWNFESMDFISTPPASGACPSGTQPVYRAYNNGYTRGIDSNHRITHSSSAIQEVVSRGWSNEGVVMCAPL